MKHGQEKESGDAPSSDAERITALEARLDLIVRCNCLLECERTPIEALPVEEVEKP